MLLTVPAAALRRKRRGAAPLRQSSTVPPRDENQIVTFSADQVTYDSNADVVTASGEVRMNREGNYLAADQVIWDRKIGPGLCQGQCRHDHARRRQARRRQRPADRHDGERHRQQSPRRCSKAAGASRRRRGTRVNGVNTFYNAIYSPCPVTTDSGCPKTAELVDHRRPGDRRSRRAISIRFEGGRFQLFGINIPLLPIFKVPRTERKGRAAGWFRSSAFQAATASRLPAPYHWQIAPNRDLTITPHIYTSVLPAIDVKYRELNSLGAFQVSGFLTYGRIDNSSLVPNPDTPHSFRGYFDSNGRWQLSPEWSITESLRVATDKTVTRRYDITNDDRLRNVINAERITPDSYISIAGWAFQGLRADDQQKQIPIALAGDRCALSDG